MTRASEGACLAGALLIAIFPGPPAWGWWTRSHYRSTPIISDRAASLDDFPVGVFADHLAALEGVEVAIPGLPFLLD